MKQNENRHKNEEQRKWNKMEIEKMSQLGGNGRICKIEKNI